MSEDSRGFVYVVEFSNGVIKVGMTRRKSSLRLATYTSSASLMGCEIKRVWKSELVENRFEEEQMLIDFCSSSGLKHHGNEWFKGVSFEDLTNHAEYRLVECILDDHEIKKLTDENRISRPIRFSDEEWDAFKKYFGPSWLRKQIAIAIKKEQRKPTAHKTKE